MKESAIGTTPASGLPGKELHHKMGDWMDSPLPAAVRCDVIGHRTEMKPRSSTASSTPLKIMSGQERFPSSDFSVFRALLH